MKIGSGIRIADATADRGKITGVILLGALVPFGRIIGTGSRESTQGGITDQFGGNYAVIQIDCGK